MAAAGGGLLTVGSVIQRVVTQKQAGVVLTPDQVTGIESAYTESMRKSKIGSAINQDKLVAAIKQSGIAGLSEVSAADIKLAIEFVTPDHTVMADELPGAE